MLDFCVYLGLNEVIMHYLRYVNEDYLYMLRIGANRGCVFS